MLTHVDDKNNPTMVDVTEKRITPRSASAGCVIQLPEVMRQYFSGDELHMQKGPVFQTAIIAGTMAVKRTYELIPFCHQIPVEGCRIDISTDKDLKVSITCTVKTTYKTGVEMEALHGALTAALTIYDMTKAISHDMVISDARLLSKTGGKNTLLQRPLYGLVLTGGKSERMKRDKALINYKGVPHAKYLFELLVPFCKEVYLSARSNQWSGTQLEGLPVIEDSVLAGGPMTGILSAFERHPNADWLIVACDLAHLDQYAIEKLLSNHEMDGIATAFKNKEKGFPEPLCALYTPKAREVFLRAKDNLVTCPVKAIKNETLTLLDQSEGINLANINTIDEYTEVLHEIC